MEDKTSPPSTDNDISQIYSEDKASNGSDALTAKGKGCVTSIAAESHSVINTVSSCSSNVEMADAAIMRVYLPQSGSALDSVLAVGMGHWDKDAVIEALVACNNSPSRAIHILSSDNGNGTSDAPIAKGKDCLNSDAAETTNMTTQVNSTVAGSAIISESNVKLVFQVGDGKWGIDAVKEALIAANNNAASAIVSLISGSAANPGPSSPQSPMAKKLKKAKSAGSEPVADVLAPSPQASASPASSKKNKKGSEPVADVLASSPEAPGSPASSKEEKKVTCARCKKNRKACPVDCPFVEVFRLDNQSDYEQASKLFSPQNMQNLLSKVVPQSRPHVYQCIMWEVQSWADDPVRGPLGLLQDLQEKVIALTEQVQQQQEQEQVQQEQEQVQQLQG